MTSEEEALFRAAARTALAMGGDIAMAIVGNVKRDGRLVEEFEVLRIESPGQAAVALFIPERWEHEPDAEDRCQAIIREEYKAMTGEALD